jgi:hypothetical protein
LAICEPPTLGAWPRQAEKKRRGSRSAAAKLRARCVTRPRCRGRGEGPDRRTCRYGPLARREIHRATRSVGSWSRKCSPEEASPSVRPWPLRNRLVAGGPWTADTGCRSEDRSRRDSRPSQRYGGRAASKRLACRVGLHGIRPVLFLRSSPERNGAIRHRPPPPRCPAPARNRPPTILEAGPPSRSGHGPFV